MFKQKVKNWKLIEVLNEIFEEFMCPISKDFMNDPVVAAHGHSYERCNYKLV